MVQIHAGAQNMNPQKILEEVQNGEAVILDVRTDGEWKEGHIDGALHFDLARIMQGEKPDIDTSKHIYTYCRSGGRATTALPILEEQGFKHATCIGGYLDWKEKGGSVVE